MRKKLKLLQADAYGYHVATLYLAEMLCAYLKGHKHYRRIGSEQGDVPEWDDFVIEEDDGAYTHVQVKRQESAFCENKTLRALKKKGKINEFQDLSPLDSSLISLANYFDSNPEDVTSRRTFSFEVPGGNVWIKKDLFLKSFKSLCDESRKAGVSAVSLEMEARNNKEFYCIYEWLTSWCGFKDWSHIFRMLKSLRIKYRADEEGIEESVRRELGVVFLDAAEAAKLIRVFLQDNSTNVGATEPRILAQELRRLLRPDHQQWTLYCRGAGPHEWYVSGIAGGYQSGSIESPSNVVRAFWNPKAGRFDLKTWAPFPLDELSEGMMESALTRLALHVPTSTFTSFKSAASWGIGIANAVGKTLGLSEADFDSFRWNEASDGGVPSVCRAVNSRLSARNEALELSSAMDDETWKIIVTELDEKIHDEISNVDLQSRVHQLWSVCKTELESRPEERAKFLWGLMRPSCEGESIYAAARVGIRSAATIAKGLWFLLIVSVAIDLDNSGWDGLRYGKNIRVICLRYWSGPAGKRRRVRLLIDDADSTEKLLSEELTDVLILSGVQDSVSRIENCLMSSDDEDFDNLAKPRLSRLTVTDSADLRSIIRKGSIEDLKAHFRKYVDRPDLRARLIKKLSEPDDHTQEAQRATSLAN